jgi:hypothetical protein
MQSECGRRSIDDIYKEQKQSIALIGCKKSKDEILLCMPGPG